MAERGVGRVGKNTVGFILTRLAGNGCLGRRITMTHAVGPKPDSQRPSIVKEGTAHIAGSGGEIIGVCPGHGVSLFYAAFLSYVACDRRFVGQF